MDVKPKRRLVDGIAPRTSPASRHTHPLQSVPMAQPRPQALPPQPQQATKARPRAVAQQPQPLHEPHRFDFTAPEAYESKRRWWKNLWFPFAILVCLSASFVVQSLPLGMAAIAVYGVVAWIRHIPSRVSFIMGFLSLLTVVVLLVVRQNVDLASNFSTYTFLLLVVGIVSAMLESRAKPKSKRSKIPHLRT